MSETEQPWHDTERLRELYEDRGMSSTKIANKWGCNPDTIIRNLRKNDIPVRGRKGSSSPPASREELHRMRVEEGMSLTEMGRELDRSGPGVRYWLKKFGIGDYEPRTSSEGAELDTTSVSGDAAPSFGDWDVITIGELREEGVDELDELITALQSTRDAFKSGDIYGVRAELILWESEPMPPDAED